MESSALIVKMREIAPPTLACMHGVPDQQIMREIHELGELEALVAFAARRGMDTARDAQLARFLADPTGGCDRHIILAPSFIAHYFAWKGAIETHLSDKCTLNVDYFTATDDEEIARACALADEITAAPASAPAPIKSRATKKRPIVFAITQSRMREFVTRSRVDAARELHVFFTRLDAIMPEYNRAHMFFVLQMAYNSGAITAVARPPEPTHDGFCYIATTAAYEARDIYKFGRTLNPTSRLSSYNSGRAADDRMEFRMCSECYNTEALEAYVLHATRAFADVAPDGKSGKHSEIRKMKYADLEYVFKRALRMDRKCARRMTRARASAQLDAPA